MFCHSYLRSCVLAVNVFCTPTGPSRSIRLDCLVPFNSTVLCSKVDDIVICQCIPNRVLRAILLTAMLRFIFLFRISLVYMSR